MHSSLQREMLDGIFISIGGVWCEVKFERREKRIKKERSGGKE